MFQIVTNIGSARASNDKTPTREGDHPNQRLSVIWLNERDNSLGGLDFWNGMKKKRSTRL